MVVLVIDNHRAARESLCAMLQALGCTVRPADDATWALSNLDGAIDLVIADVALAGFDGFAVADAVALRFGTNPPRTLLMSRESHAVRLNVYPPAVIIGILPKPMSFAHLRCVLDRLTQTRTACPGRHHDTCPHATAQVLALGAAQRRAPLCQTRHYGTCPLYDAFGGQPLRQWIRQRPEALPA